mgnify:CR=1 FL=1
MGCSTHQHFQHFGDLGEFVDGKLKVHGRKDELINTGGYKVWPSSVSAVIRNINQVSDVVVAGTPDDKWGSAVTAWIVLKKSATIIASFVYHTSERAEKIPRKELPKPVAPRN